MKPSENTRKNLKTLLGQYPRGHVVAAASLVMGLGLLMVLPASEGTTSSRQSQTVSLDLEKTFATPVAPALEALAQQPALEEEPTENLTYADVEPEEQLERTQFTVKSGDSLSLLFQRAGLSDRDLYQLINEASEAGALQRIMPGNQITFALDQDGAFLGR